jgi:hypothetical protein
MHIFHTVPPLFHATKILVLKKDIMKLKHKMKIVNKNKRLAPQISAI